MMQQTMVLVMLVGVLFCQRSVSSASVARMTIGQETASSWSNRSSVQQTLWAKRPPLPPYDPPQCKDYACPPCTVLADRGSYKKVYFPVAPYVKSRLEGKTLVPATLELYKRLRGYITGDNENKEHLPMTAPVILRMDPGEDGMWSPKNFTLFFLMDPSVKSPPAPTDDKVEVLEVNSYTLYIRTFSGFPVTYGDWMREMLQLAADVEADGEPYTKNYYYFSSYDPPTKMTGRINEVQLLKPHKDSFGP